MTMDDKTSPPYRPRILHISGDFPDPIEPGKTPVIRSLVNLTNEAFAHRVYSINRQSPGAAKLIESAARSLSKPALAITLKDFEYGTAFAYEAPARGLFHKTMLRQLGNRLATKATEDAVQPDILVAHKLTIEGIAVAQMARQLNVPYALCIQGNTDTKILSARPDLRQEFRAVFHEAASVFAFAPWALQRFEAAFGPRNKPTYLLPCATTLDTPIAPSMGGEGLVSAFHLRNQETKNLIGLTRAMRLLFNSGVDAKLTIYGGGTVQDRIDCTAIISEAPNIDLAGPIEHDALPPLFNRAAGFVMPSIRESFGLVFIEALFAGLPIIYPKSASVDGYFDDLPFALGVDARSPRQIMAAMDAVLDQQSSMKEALGDWQLSRHAQCFRRPSIGQVFRDGLMQAIAR